MRRFHHLSILLLSAAVLGCGQDMPPSADADKSSTDSEIRFSGVTASVSEPGQQALPPDGGKVQPEGESLDEATRQLSAIQQLRVAPVPEGIEDAREVRRKRNLQIVQMATEVLRLTLDNQGRRDDFAAAVRQLLEARYQLALSGSESDIEQLYADVQALNERDPHSAEAAEGIYHLARFAHTKARLQGRGNVAWFENFSRWAREFADRFPNQRERATALLFGAGRSCEMHAVVIESVKDAVRLRTEAKLCYSALTSSYPKSSQAREATAVLRRMALPGKRLSQFAGPTLNGGYVNADEFTEKVTVIYFWDGQNKEFVEKLLPLLQQAKEASNNKLRFVGVPLEEDEAALRDYLQDTQVPGQQIFFADPAQRSWNSPLIRYWGISLAPSVWLIERDGRVKAVDVGGFHLVDTMRQLFQ